MERTVGKLLRTSYCKLSEMHRMPLHLHRAAQQLSACRTPAMGGHIQGCPEGHASRVVFHSCKHRLCPQCNTLPTERWLMKMRSRLIDCAHHHLIFTIPHQLHDLWRYNRTWMMQVLFSSAADTLKTLCKDPKYLDSMPGFTLALHTWGRSLQLHPHIHCLITDGGLKNGEWRTPRGSCFLPARVVMFLFRGKLLAALRIALADGTLRLPPDLSIERCRSLLNKLGRVKWNVNVRERYDHGQGVVTYFGQLRARRSAEERTACSNLGATHRVSLPLTSRDGEGNTDAALRALRILAALLATHAVAQQTHRAALRPLCHTS